MADECRMCPELRAELMALRAQVAATSALIRAEREEPTMPWKKLLHAVEARLEMALGG